MFENVCPTTVSHTAGDEQVTNKGIHLHQPSVSVHKITIAGYRGPRRPKKICKYIEIGKRLMRCGGGDLMDTCQGHVQRKTDERSTTATSDCLATACAAAATESDPYDELAVGPKGKRRNKKETKKIDGRTNASNAKGNNIRRR